MLAVVNPVLKEIRDKTGETACFFKVEQNFRVCVAVAETHHALRRECTWARSSRCMWGPRHESCWRGIQTWRRRSSPRPLEPMTDGTVTSPDELRRLIAQAKADGYAITAGEREDSASGLSAPVFDAAATSWARSPSAARRAHATGAMRGMDRPSGRLCRASHPNNRRPPSALSPREEPLRRRLHPREKRCPTWLPSCQYSSPPQRSCSAGQARASPFGRATHRR